MKAIVSLLCVALLAGPSLAGQPQLKSVRLSISPYVPMSGGSNSVVVIYKSIWLGTVATPWKPTAYMPASRTNITVSILPGLYFFRAAAQEAPFAESQPSNTITNNITP